MGNLSMNLKNGRKKMTMSNPVDNSEDGITIGLVDAIITVAATLSERLEAEVTRRRDIYGGDADDRAYLSRDVQEALEDLAGNKTVRDLLWPRDDKCMDLIINAAKRLKEKEND